MVEGLVDYFHPDHILVVCLVNVGGIEDDAETVETAVLVYVLVDLLKVLCFDSLCIIKMDTH